MRCLDFVHYGVPGTPDPILIILIMHPLLDGPGARQGPPEAECGRAPPDRDLFTPPSMPWRSRPLFGQAWASATPG
eukprot:9136753-Pyramimonas_sp.AAC.1